MARILCIETSGLTCSVAIHDDAGLIAHRTRRADQYIHSEKLHVFISEAMAEAGLDPGHLEAVAVSGGPGSYTGLRIGVAAAKGLAMALDIPLIAVPTCRVIAGELRRRLPGSPAYVAMIDARRMEVYTASFDSEMNETAGLRAVVLSDSFFAAFPPGTVFGGDGAAKGAVLSAQGASLVELYPDASMMGEEARERLDSGRTEDAAYYEPVYLKEFIPGVGSATSS